MQSDRVASSLETKAVPGSAWASMKALNLGLTLVFHSLRALGLLQDQPRGCLFAAWVASGV